MDPDLVKYNLDCSASYRMASEADRNKVYNGCGADWMPEWLRRELDTITIYFKEAIRIHDWDYTYLPKTEKCKKLADLRFLKNCMKIVAFHFKWWWRPKQWLKYRGMARGLYLAVKHGGDKAFYGE